MQQSRFELKYLLNEETALRIREFVRCHIGFDEYSVGKPNFSYPVHSLYFDSDQLTTYWDTVNGNKNRFKLRIRYYDATPGSPVFFEIKRRMNNCILKQRGGVRIETVPWILSGHYPEPSHMLSKNPKQYVALQRFCQIRDEIHAKPKVHVAYEREAYVSDDDAHRVTIDRAVRSVANLTGVLTTKMDNPTPSFPNIVILELKFTNRFPTWYRELVEVFNLMQCGAAKYLEGVQHLGHVALESPNPVIEDEPPRLRSINEPYFSPNGSRRGKIPTWVDTAGDD